MIEKENDNELGQFGEEMAMEHLMKEGYVIRERNWRAKNHAEIDIIAQYGEMIVFVEVKSRSGTFQDPLEAVTPKKIRKIISGANIYMKMVEHDYSYRFDIISIKGTPDHFELEHIPDAFIPPLRGWR
ncbi:MAG: YraN family protein [Clostridium sp.]|nr:YraN family protein [Prevotella sp.]MCM1429282.1 YraN family protein [Clostridium sp.]MCM1475685.1 YraN family protein [Muribaculaceae bacterium]